MTWRINSKAINVTWDDSTFKTDKPRRASYQMAPRTQVSMYGQRNEGRAAMFEDRGGSHTNVGRGDYHQAWPFRPM